MTDRRPLYENAKPKGGMRKPLELPDLDEAVIAYGHACRMDYAQKSGETDRARRAAFKRYQRVKREWEDMVTDHHGDCDICGCGIPPDSDPPLCDPCHRTAKAAGEQSRAAKRWPDPEHGGVAS